MPLRRLVLHRGLGRTRRGRGAQVVHRVVLDELDEGLVAPVTREVDELLRAGGLELERGEALDLEVDCGGEVVLRRVHLGTAKDMSGEGLMKAAIRTYMTRRSLRSA